MCKVECWTFLGCFCRTVCGLESRHCKNQFKNIMRPFLQISKNLLILIMFILLKKKSALFKWFGFHEQLYSFSINDFFTLLVYVTLKLMGININIGIACLNCIHMLHTLEQIHYCIHQFIFIIVTPKAKGYKNTWSGSAPGHRFGQTIFQLLLFNRILFNLQEYIFSKFLDY